MAQIIVHILVPMILLVLVAGVVGTPPGIAKNPSHASCKIKKYKHCYNLVHVCPKFCPDECTVECASCKPICVGGSNPPPEYSPSPSTPHNPKPSPTTTPSIPDHKSPPSSSTPTHKNPPPSTPSPKKPPTPPSPPKNPPPSPSPTTPSTPKNPSPPSSTPPPSTPTPSTPENPPPSPPSSKYSPPSSSTPPLSPPAPSTPSENPPASSPTPSPSPAAPSTPEKPSPSSPTPANPPPSPSTRNSPTPTGTSSPKKARCNDKNYPKCYNMEHACPNGCRDGCEVDCQTCKPVCKCDRPGAVCQDPRFIGGDGITFYFHGKKDTNFCLVSDPNLHINAHFIGRRNHNMNRDFTWVQSIAILLDNHQLFIGAHRTSLWEDSTDHLALSFDNQPITLHQSQGATWKSPSVNIVRSSSTNNVIIEVEGRLRVTAKVVPITEEESRVHNYGITREDCFAHLDLGFKFFSLSNNVSGVLGQTYKPDYVSRVNIGAKMPIMGGGKEFETTTLFTPDCSVARFDGNNEEHKDEVAMEGMEIPSLNCASGIDGQGVVCRR